MSTNPYNYLITLLFAFILGLYGSTAYAAGGFLVDLAQAASKWADDVVLDGSKVGKHLDELASEAHHLDNLAAKGISKKATYIRNFDEISLLANKVQQKKQLLNLLRSELISNTATKKELKQVSHALLNDAYKGQKLPLDADASYQLLIESSEKYGDNALLRTTHYIDSDEGSRLYKVFSDAKPIKRVEADEMKLFFDDKLMDDLTLNGDMRCAKMEFRNYMQGFKARYGNLDIAEQHDLLVDDGLDKALTKIFKTYTNFIIEQAANELGVQALLPLKNISIKQGVVKVELFELCGTSISFEHQFKEQNYALTGDGRKVKIVPQLVPLVGVTGRG